MPKLLLYLISLFGILHQNITERKLELIKVFSFICRNCVFKGDTKKKEKEVKRYAGLKKYDLVQIKHIKKIVFSKKKMFLLCLILVLHCLFIS